MGDVCPGQKVGNYVVLELLGEGSMAKVFKAVHERIGRHVAIKVLKQEASRDREITHRFLAEARAVNIVRHSGVVEIQDIGQLDDGAYYAVMEYLEGENILQRIRAAAGRLPQGEVLHYGREIALAMAAVHAKGIIHRDLKPANVMIVRDEGDAAPRRIKVLDFGIAKLPAVHHNPDDQMMRTRDRAIMGTLAYMAPEQFQGAGGVGPLADVYSLGIMMLQMLVGQLPFVAKSDYELWRMHHEERPPALRDKRPELPSELTELVHAMLGKDPGRRPSMSEVARQIERLQSAIPVEDRSAQAAVAAETPAEERTTQRGPAPAVVPATVAVQGAEPAPPQAERDAVPAPDPAVALASAAMPTALDLAVAPASEPVPAAPDPATSPLPPAAPVLTSAPVPSPPAQAAADRRPWPAILGGLLLLATLVGGATSLLVKPPLRPSPSRPLLPAGDAPSAIPDLLAPSPPEPARIEPAGPPMMVSRPAAGPARASSAPGKAGRNPRKPGRSKAAAPSTPSDPTPTPSTPPPPQPAESPRWRPPATLGPVTMPHR